MPQTYGWRQNQQLAQKLQEFQKRRVKNFKCATGNARQLFSLFYTPFFFSSVGSSALLLCAFVFKERWYAQTISGGGDLPLSGKKLASPLCMAMGNTKASIDLVLYMRQIRPNISQSAVSCCWEINIEYTGLEIYALAHLSEFVVPKVDVIWRQNHTCRPDIVPEAQRNRRESTLVENHAIIFDMSKYDCLHTVPTDVSLSVMTPSILLRPCAGRTDI
jgi:hypothetical protein